MSKRYLDRCPECRILVFTDEDQKIRGKMIKCNCGTEYKRQNGKKVVLKSMRKDFRKK